MFAALSLSTSHPWSEGQHVELKGRIPRQVCAVRQLKALVVDRARVLIAVLPPLSPEIPLPQVCLGLW